MLSDIQLQLLQWAGKGYCCSQILVGLALEYSGLENPQLIRAAEGLCSGMFSCNGACGLLSGGALLIGLYTGHDAETEEKNEDLPILLESFTEWFTQKTTEKHGDITCGQILGESSGTPVPDTAVCGSLLAETFAYIESLLAEYGYDIAAVKE
ncbi:DVU_1555 family C-GCAxxG-C-C protein [Halodesulfovibrio marinisediminis]|uniref:Putative redox-active protein (C_GCAxxG_C_C) n=1 Tax=Halodesulfovibrio marinisediminis DSM 17456 TaxID=1121457 RepID=A0A1N6GWH7_9BACT|nr:DV_1555 family C-GCAxxG-C-C protein [Halodesulfovibrio marinisediminis]SIO11941.1 Putative redox-active protein (C_GCAxxG_C_C) [Halodesulfovibrio marinisediminis DSM 17456]